MRVLSDYIFETDSGCANITLSTLIYVPEVIHSATYPFTPRYHILITPNTDDSVVVIFQAKETASDVVGDLKEFVNSLIDYQVRFQLDQTNGKIRDLIVAHAFSPLDLQKETKSL
ncbi:MAG: His-Xaa-Ser system protein HxsD [Gammaproteobacteria bacterium]|nr:His-Xaa-Ser system protein HxsD [Gammaproteobacteria bacterium]MDR3665689.1 His-Xaa-Ser system protein HxsD [Ignavibacteriaceae bacterium]